MNKITKCLTVLFAVVIALASSALKANGSVIDLGERELASPLPGVPGAMAYIEADQGLPPGTLNYLNLFDADEGFENNGAVDSSHFDVSLIDGGVNANISWDLSTSGYQLSYVWLKDGRESKRGPYLYHLYGVTPDEVFNSMGDQFVTIDGVRYITYLAFFGVPGSPSVPEGGATLILLGFALGAVELVRRSLPRRAA